MSAYRDLMASLEAVTLLEEGTALLAFSDLVAVDKAIVEAVENGWLKAGDDD